MVTGDINNLADHKELQLESVIDLTLRRQVCLRESLSSVTPRIAFYNNSKL